MRKLVTTELKNGPASLPAALAAAILIWKSGSGARKIYNTTFDPKKNGLPSFETSTQLAISQGLLTSNGSTAIEALEKSIGIGLAAVPNLPAYDLLKVTAVCRVAGLPLNFEGNTTLKNWSSALPVIAGSLAGRPRLNLGHSISKNVRAIAARAITETFLLEQIPGLALQSASPSAFSDPVLKAVFSSATGNSVDLNDGFEKIIQRRVNDFLGNSPQQKWKAFLRACAVQNLSAVVERMRSRQAGGDFFGKLSRALSERSFRTPSGWIAISEAHRAFSATDPISLSEFKDLIAEGATEGIVELSPISVGSLIKEETQSRSELGIGGLTFHLLRMGNH